MKHKNLFRATIALAAVVMLIPGCYYESGPQNRIEASGPIVTRELNISEFNGVILANSAEVLITHGDRQRVEVEGQENIIRNLSTEVSGRVWKIKNHRPVWRHYDLRIKITMPDIAMLKLSGSGEISTINSFDKLNDLDLIISGSGTINLNIRADDVMGRISGSGSLYLKGTARQVDFQITGSGGIHAMSLKARYGTAHISGSGGIKLYATDDLEARITGSGSISYRGKPRVDSRISGSGTISSR